MIFLILFSGFYSGVIEESGFHKWNFYIKEDYIWNAPRSELGYTIDNYGLQFGYRSDRKWVNMDVNVTIGIPNETWLGMYDTDYYPDGEDIFIRSWSHDESQFYDANISLTTGYKVLFLSTGMDVNLYNHKMNSLYYDIIWWEDVSKWENKFNNKTVLTYDEYTWTWYWSLIANIPIFDWLSIGGEYKWVFQTERMWTDEHPLRGFSIRANLSKCNYFKQWTIWGTFRIKNFPISIGYERYENKYSGYGYVFRGKFWFTNEGSFNQFWLRIGG